MGKSLVCRALPQPRLGADDDVIDKIAYVAANPTEAGLVESPEQWPGVMLLPEADVRTLEVTRPAKYFSDAEVFPETVALRVIPVVSKTQSAADVFQRVTVATQRAVARARNAILACGRSFLGQAGVLSHSFRKRAESFEPKRGPIPKVRARNRMLLLGDAGEVFGVLGGVSRGAKDLAEW